MKPFAKEGSIGIGWRPELAHSITRLDEVRFVEIIAESVLAESLPTPVRQLRESGIAVVPHGITLSLGGAERPDPVRLSALASLAELLDSPFVSEHVAFVRAGRIETGHLLPVPRTRESLAVLVENVREAQGSLPVPLALENIATLFEWPGAEMDEATFLAELLERTRALLLLDISNLYANARNFKWDAESFLSRIPLERIAYVHIAGGLERGGFYHDTHAHAIAAGALELLEELCARTLPPPILLERDDHFPPEAELAAELDAITRAVSRGMRRAGRSDAAKEVVYARG